MKLLRHGAVGSERAGIIDPTGTVRDVSSLVPDFGGGARLDEAVSKLSDADLANFPKVPPQTRIGACVAMPTNFVAVGLNYADHAEEAGMPIPAEPILFSKSPNCIVGPDDDVIAPRGSTKLDWEIELAFVIAKRTYQVSEDAAMDHVAGFCICNDVSERAWQIEGTGQWLKGKSAPTFGPLGPWLVTPDEVPDPAALSMKLTVNGETVQNGSTKTMIFNVPFLVSYISRFMELLPGDVITTGTPPGVGMGMKPPRYLKIGDVMELRIERLGVQKQTVVREDHRTG